MDERARLDKLTVRWQAEKALVEQLLALRAKLRGSTEPVEGTGSTLERIASEHG